MLLDAACKIISAILASRLTTLLTQGGSVEEQNGFLPARGCTDAVFTLKVMLQKRKEHGLEAAPMTHGTRRMLRLVVFQILPDMYKRYAHSLHRMRWQVCVEALGGLRVGEATGGEEGHGLLANNTFIITQLGTFKKFVELKLEHSKTGFARYINIVYDTCEM